jgi:hypothetical protein
MDTVLVSVPSRFYTLPPCRLVDTRPASGAPIGGPALEARSIRVLAVANECGIPSSAQALAVNVTVTAPGADGNLRLFPAGLALPQVSSVNYRTGQTRGSNGIVALSDNAEIAAYVSQLPGTTAHVIVDVTGYFE